MLLKSVTTLCVICGVFTISSVKTISVDQQECPTFCTLNYSPLCATDGKVYKEFSNGCELKATNCRLGRSALKKYIPTSMDCCLTELVDNLQLLLDKLDSLDLDTPNCINACPLIYKPVCISNGQYRAVVSNECIMDGINCALAKKSKAAFSVLKQDIC